MPAHLSKAVILARGLGTRMRRQDPTAHLQPEQTVAADHGMKAMIPVGRPFLDYVLSGLADAGFRQVCLVIGPEHAAVREHYGRAAMRRIHLQYAVQEQALGTANAVVAAEDFVGGDEFLVMNSDNYYPLEVLTSLRTLGEPGTVLFDAEGLARNSNIPFERIRQYASAEVRNGYLVRLAEKPASMDAHALVSMNIWRLPPTMIQHCGDVELSQRKEYELPLAVNLAIERGVRLRVETSELGVLDLSQRGDVPAMAERLRDVEVRL